MRERAEQKDLCRGLPEMADFSMESMRELTINELLLLLTLFNSLCNHAQNSYC